MRKLGAKSCGVLARKLGVDHLPEVKVVRVRCPSAEVAIHVLAIVALLVRVVFFATLDVQKVVVRVLDRRAVQEIETRGSADAQCSEERNHIDGRGKLVDLEPEKRKKETGG